MRRNTLVLGALICAALAAFAVAQFFAIRGLQAENVELRRSVKDAVSSESSSLREQLLVCQSSLSEHRAEQRDRDFKMTQLIQLEAVRTRDYMKEICRP